MVALDGAVNFRELGGYPTEDGRRVKWRRLFRSGKLDRLTAASIPQAAALGIGTVVDLRYPNEVETHATPRDAFPNAQFLFWTPRETKPQATDTGSPRRWTTIIENHDAEGLRRVMQEKYVRYLTSHGDLIRSMLTRLAESDAPLLFHCAAGKDRTGVVAAVLLSLLGVDRATIEQDYLLSQMHLQEKMEAWAAGGAAAYQQYGDLMRLIGEHGIESTRPLFAADVQYLRHLFDTVDRRYGSFFSYVKHQLKLTDAHIDNLRDKLLTV